MEMGKGATFWCPECEMGFSNTDKNGIAVCPRCRHKRGDGLNLLPDGRFQCIKCGSKFPDLSKTKQPSCINGCEYNGG